MTNLQSTKLQSPIRESLRLRDTKVHKRCLVASISWDIFSNGFRRRLCASWAMLMQADESELKDELHWARSQPSSLYGKTLESIKETYPELRDNMFLTELQTLKSRSSYMDALTFWELKNIHKYLNLAGSRLVTFEVGQDADAWPMMGTELAVPTLLRNTSMLFSPQHWRWFAPRELLLVQGFPVVAAAKVQHEVSSFDVGQLWARYRSHMIHQAGNAMHTHMIGLAMVWASCS